MKKYLNLKNLTNKDYIIIGKMWAMGSSLTEHRVKMALHLKRPLKKGGIVHHINGDHKDNRIKNLILCANSMEHRDYHDKAKGINKKSPIRILREEKGINQQELADLVGIDRPTMSNIENPKVPINPTGDLAVKISRILGVLVTDILRKEENKEDLIEKELD